MSTDLPAIPSITASLVSNPSRVVLAVQGHDNLCSAADASFEGSLGTTSAGANCTVALSTVEALDGSQSMLVTVASAGTYAYTAQSGTAYPCVPGQTYTGISHVYPTTADNLATSVAYYNASGGLLTYTSVTPTACPANTWTELTATAVAPVGASFVTVSLQIPSPAVAGELIYVDEVGIFTGTATTWTRGGLVGSSTVSVLRNDGVYVVGAPGGPASPVLPGPTQTLNVDDNYVVPGATYTYTAVVNGGGATSSTSNPSDSVAIPAVVPPSPTDNNGVILGPIPAGRPHFAIPFSVVNGSAQTVEQDSAAEITQSVGMLVGTRPKTRYMVPSYGLADPTFAGANPSAIRRAVATWEERAVISISTDPGNAEQVTVAVTTR